MELLENDAIYAGLRVGSKGKKLCQYYFFLKNEEGKLELTQFSFLYKRALERVIGSVYRGCTVSGSSVRGLAEAKYQFSYNDKEQLVLWEAENHNTIREFARVKIEKENSTSMFDKELANLKKIYQSIPYLSQREAFESLVIETLRKKNKTGLER